MNNFLCNDVTQLISQYSVDAYGLLRLMNKRVKHAVDEVLPNCPIEQKIRFLQGAHWCGFTLMDQCAFDAWLDALDRVYGKEGISGETVERFCRNYRKNARNQSVLKIEQKVLHILCKYNRVEYVRDLWNSMQKDESIYCDWMKEVGMLDDLEFVEMVHELFTKHCKDKIKIKNIIRTSIQGAVECHQWEIIPYLLGKHPYMKQDTSYYVCSRLQFAAGDFDVFFDEFNSHLHKDRKFVIRAMMQNGLALDFADECFKRDKEIVLLAVQQNGFSLMYAHKSLKKDKEIVLTAVKQYGRALKYADASVKKEREVILLAVKQNGDTLLFADDSFKKDKEIVLAAVKQQG